MALPALVVLLLLLGLLPPFRLDEEALEEPREFAEQTDATPEGARLVVVLTVTFGLCIGEVNGVVGDAEARIGPSGFCACC